MLVVSGSLGGYALIADAQLRDAKPDFSDVVSGSISAALLYGIVRAAEAARRGVAPWASGNIDAIYRWRQLMPPLVIAAYLAGIIAPGEELFWRGLVQGALVRRLGTTRGVAAAIACYATTQAASGNLALVGGAAVAGAFWSTQYQLQRRLAPVIVSHILWDISILLLFPSNNPPEGTA
jgi:membrane protease YdiL (CAAX protease family)